MEERDASGQVGSAESGGAASLARPSLSRRRALIVIAVDDNHRNRDPDHQTYLRQRQGQHGEDHPRVNTLSVMGVAVFVMTSALLLASCGDDSRSTATAASCQPRETTIRANSGAASAPSTLPEGDAALVAAVAGTFCSVFTVTLPDGTKRSSRPPKVTPGDASCIAKTLIDRLGAARVRSLELGLWPWGTLGFALTNEIDRREAEKIVDTFKTCSKTWKLLLITSITQGADEISDQSADCISEQLSNHTARTIFVGEIDRAYDDPSQPNAQPYSQLEEPLVAAFDKCLTPSELAAMDWD
jgi:hypothetical protein